MAEQTIINNASLKRFEYHEDGEIAFIEYSYQSGDIAFLHTLVPEKIAGKGIAGKLAEFAFSYAKEHHLKVINYCPYIASYIKKHPEVNDQLDKEFLPEN